MKLELIHVGMVMTNCYILTNEETGEAALIDPGDEADRLLACCRDRRLTAILLTHGHFDHILAVPRLREASGARIYAPAAEVPLLMDSDENLSGPWQGRPGSVRADVTLQDGEEFELLGTRIRMLLTPGHTAGSCCYYLPQEGWLFSGDTLFCESYGRVDLPTAMPDAISRSVRELLALPADTRVFPGHGGGTDIAHERKCNPLAHGWKEEDVK